MRDHQVGLSDDTRLKKGINEVEVAVAKVNGRAAESRPLAQSLGHLKSLLYNADDIVDKLDYFRLRYEIEGGMFAPARISRRSLPTREEASHTRLTLKDENEAPHR